MFGGVKMWRAILATAMAVLAAGGVLAQGQQESNHCLWMKSRIQAMEASLSGLTQFATNPNITLMQCTLDPGDPDTVDGWYACMDDQGAMGMWRDPETKIIYLVYTKQWVRDYAQNSGASQAALDRAFNQAEPVRNKVAHGGVLPGLAAEIENWKLSYAEDCGGAIVPVDPCDDGSINLLCQGN